MSRVILRFGNRCWYQILASWSSRMIVASGITPSRSSRVICDRPRVRIPARPFFALIVAVKLVVASCSRRSETDPIDAWLNGFNDSSEAVQGRNVKIAFAITFPINISSSHSLYTTESCSSTDRIGVASPPARTPSPASH